MCAVHGLWDTFLEDLPDGHQPWHSIGPSQARRRLRDLLQRYLVPDAQKYGTQDFRRGHAEDMRKSGCSLAEILKAGQWRSAAFMKYMDEAGIDKAGLFSKQVPALLPHACVFAQDMAFELAMQSEEEWID